jgi:hypothetical protein
MQASLTMTEPRKRKSRGRKPTSSVTYRLTPKVKLAIAEISALTGRSENQQAEHFFKIAYLHTKGSEYIRHE